MRACILISYNTVRRFSVFKCLLCLFLNYYLTTLALLYNIYKEPINDLICIVHFWVVYTISKIGATILKLYKNIQNTRNDTRSLCG